jgi:hypothetical protein
VSRLVDAQTVAAHLGVPESWVREQTRRGVIPYVPLGPRYKRYDLDRVDEWWHGLAREPGGRRPAA